MMEKNEDLGQADIILLGVIEQAKPQPLFI